MSTKTVVIRYRLHLEIYYQDLRLKIKQHFIDDEQKLRQYISRYFELNYKNPVITAFYVAKILRS